jgi:multidrug efflux pump subunit AcrB
MAARRPHGHRHHRNILLIGIVKKKTIAMIDFALDAQRPRTSRRARRSIRRACCGSARS